MVKRNNSLKLGIILVLCACFSAVAQENRYVIFFTDKDHSSYSIDRPEEFLSLRAIERRENQNIAITAEDLPVSQAYLDSLSAKKIDSYHQSKWFNATIVQADSVELLSLNSASYIDTIIFVGPGAKLRNPYAGNSASINGNSNLENAENATNTTIDPADKISLTQNTMLGVDEMHEAGFMGEGMLIGVFDGGFNNVDGIPAFDHLFEENKIIATRNFVDNNDSIYQFSDHGTSALSCIAGYIPEVFIGTAPNASFVLCVTEDVQGEYRVEEFNWTFAAEYADSLGVDVINTSLGYSTFLDSNMNYTYDDLDGQTAFITRASAIAAKKGIVLVNSAGNEGGNSWRYVSAPADAENILSVGAVNARFEKASFSSIGPTADGRLKPEISALGTDVVVVDESGGISYARGTSFASPLVAGLVAGFWQANPTLNNDEVMNRIKMSGHKASSPNNELGYGVPDFSRAMEQKILGAYTESAESFKLYPNPISNDKLFVKISRDHLHQDIDICLFNNAGVVVKKSSFTDYQISNPLIIDFSDILPGIYFIKVVSRETSEAAKVVNF